MNKGDEDDVNKEDEDDVNEEEDDETGMEKSSGQIACMDKRMSSNNICLEMLFILGHEFLWKTRSTSRIRHCGNHRYYVHPRSEQPMHMRQLYAGGSTDLGYQTCTSAYLFDTLVTGMARADSDDLSHVRRLEKG